MDNPCATIIPISFRLQIAQDVIHLLEDLGLVRAEQFVGALEKVHTVGFLAGVALKAIEAGNLAACIKMSEPVLKQRAEGHRT